MKCDKYGCNNNACKRNGSAWVLCNEHLDDYFDGLFSIMEN